MAGNKEKISFGGQLVRDLIYSEEFVIVNNLDLAEGGPWTWVDQADPQHRCCLGLAIVSQNLLPFVTDMQVDSSRRITPERVIARRGKMTVRHTDNFALKMPEKIGRKEKQGSVEPEKKRRVENIREAD